MNIDNLVNELLAGKTSDELAAEMAEALNTAIKEKEEIEREAEERRIAEEAKKAETEIIFEHKKNAVASMIEAFTDYLELAGADEDIIKEFDDMDEEDLADLVIKFDEAIEGLLGILKLAKMLKNHEDKSPSFTEEMLENLFGL